MKIRFKVKQSFWENIKYLFGRSDINTQMPNIMISSEENGNQYKSTYAKRSLNHRPVPSYRLYDAADNELITIYADTIHMRNWYIYEGDKQIAHLYTKHQSVAKIAMGMSIPELIFNDPLYIESNEHSLMTITKLGSFWSTGAQLQEDDKEIASLSGADKETRDWTVEFKVPENNKVWIVGALSVVYGWFYRYDYI